MKYNFIPVSFPIYSCSTFRSSSSAILRDHNEIAVRKGFSLKKDFVTLVKAIVQIKNYNFDEPKETVKQVQLQLEGPYI